MNAPVFLDETLGVDRPNEPIFGGVPLPRGLCNDGGWFELVDGDGRTFRVEGAPAGWWPDGSVKWMHLCGQVDLEGGCRNAFVLRAADSDAQPALEVSRPPGRVVVRDGDFSVRMAKRPAEVLEVFRGDEPLLSKPGLSAELELVAPDGGNLRRFAWTAAAPPELVAETGARAVVRLGGRFASADGPVAELILFFEILRGLPEVRLQPVFIYLGEPQRDLVRSLRLTAYTRTCGDDAAYAFAEDTGAYTDSVRTFSAAGPRWPQARLLQLGSSFYRIDKRVSADDPWVKASEGRHSGGWCCLSDTRSSVAASMRRFWQEYPHELWLDAGRGMVRFGLWPDAAEPMDLRRYSRTVYGPSVYECLTAAYERVPVRQSGTDFQSGFGAVGIAKSHELMLRFGPPVRRDVGIDNKGEPSATAVVDERGGEPALRFANPCRLMVEPAYFAESRVTGTLASAGGKADMAAQADARIDELADFLVAERDARGWYGRLDYGDVQMCFYTPLDRWGFDHGGHAWVNTEALPDYGLWLAALRSARSDRLAAAIDMTAHNRDVDMHHRGPFRGYGSRHNVSHWGCTVKEWRISMPLVKRLHYYVTGDAWTREVIDETVRLYESQPRTMRFSPDADSAFAGVLFKAELSDAAEDWQVARRFADTLAAGIRDDGRLVRSIRVDPATGRGGPPDDTPQEGRYHFFNRFGGQHTLVEAADVLDHDGLAAGLVRYARFQLASRTDPPSHLLVVYAFALRRTGEREFREAIEEGIRRAMETASFETLGAPGPLSRPPHRAFAGLEATNKIVCLSAHLLHQCPYGLAALP